MKQVVLQSLTFPTEDRKESSNLCISTLDLDAVLRHCPAAAPSLKSCYQSVTANVQISNFIVVFDHVLELSSNYARMHILTTPTDKPN